MTEFSSVIPFKKSPCCFASPRGSKSVVLQFVNDTVLKNWKQVKQVRYQTIKQVGHFVIYTNLMSLVVACVAGGICFGDLAKRRLACVARVSVSFRSKQRLRIWPRAKWSKRHFSSRGLWLSFLVLCSETARKCLLRRLREDWDQIKRSGDREKESSHPSPACNAGYQCKKSLVKVFKQNLYVSTRFTIVLHYHQLTWYN